jgi:hypothetical protein
MSGERAWSSEDTEPVSFKVVFTVSHGIVIGLEIRSKAPKLNVRLEAEAHWLRCGRVTPGSDVNFNCGIRANRYGSLRWSRGRSYPTIFDGKNEALRSYNAIPC